MSDEQAGFLLVMMQPPPAMEEEFNAWYDTEHVPERLAVAGFLSALRYVCLSGHPRYLAMYDLDDHGVLQSAAYLSVSGERFSPWTRRVTGRVLVDRTAGVQVYPGRQISGPATRMLLLRFRGIGESERPDLVANLRALYEGRVETRSLRVLACEDGATNYGFVELRAPVEPLVDPAELGRFAEALDMVNLYAPYDPRL